MRARSHDSPDEHKKISHFESIRTFVIVIIRESSITLSCVIYVGPTFILLATFLVLRGRWVPKTFDLRWVFRSLVVLLLFVVPLPLPHPLLLVEHDITGGLEPRCRKYALYFLATLHSLCGNQNNHASRFIVPRISLSFSPLLEPLDTPADSSNEKAFNRRKVNSALLLMEWYNEYDLRGSLKHV